MNSTYIATMEIMKKNHGSLILQKFPQTKACLRKL